MNITKRILRTDLNFVRFLSSSEMSQWSRLRLHFLEESKRILGVRNPHQGENQKSSLVVVTIDHRRGGGRIDWVSSCDFSDLLLLCSFLYYYGLLELISFEEETWLILSKKVRDWLINNIVLTHCFNHLLQSMKWHKSIIIKKNENSFMHEWEKYLLIGVIRSTSSSERSLSTRLSAITS